MTSSRLDRLFVLLETGSSSVTRSAAAKQLGEVQRLHPHELNTLLSRTASYLRSTNWETRIAASEAVRAIVANVPQWNPRGVVDVKKEEEESIAPVSCMGRLRFEQFDMSKVLANSTHLMASEGKEFDLEEDSALGLDIKERMAKQRQLLNSRLGLDVAAKIGLDTSTLFSNEDLVENIDKMDYKESHCGIVKKPVKEVICSVTEGLSCREMNRAKRKARQAVNKQRSRDVGEDNHLNGEESEKKKLKTEIKDENPTVFDIETCESSDWPLEWFCDQLAQDLFSSCWEIRHGAATALREVITVHGRGAGKAIYLPAKQMEAYHQIWLEDMSIRLLCVLALDRFGDFVSDAVVAPVRETCAQALCAVLKLMNPTYCCKVSEVLLQFLSHQDWEARHGGLLGLKYLLAVRIDMIDELLSKAFPYILQGLSDPVDDVSAVAASSLIPVAPKLTELVLGSVPQVITKLWDLLSEQDELAAACNSFMGLLAAISNLPQVQSLLPLQPPNEVVPRLWPFFSHSTSSVRKATLQTLSTLTEKLSDNSPLLWEAQLLQDAMRHVFQRVLVEPIAEVREVAEKVWGNLVRNSGLVELLHAACPFVTVWLFLTMQPVKVPFDHNFFIHAKTQRKATNSLSNFDNTIGHPKYYMGGSETTPLSSREANAIQVRCMAARMLGLLSCYIVKPAPGIHYSQGIEKPIDCYEKVLLVHLNSKSALQRLVTGLVISEWAKLNREAQDCPAQLKKRLYQCQDEMLYFDEIAHSFTRLAQETRDFLATMRHYKIPVDIDNDHPLTLPLIVQLTGPTTEQILINFKLKAKILENLQERRRSIQSAVLHTGNEQKALTISTKASLSGAIVMFKALPDKLNPVVKPLMESIKYEPEESLQQISARHVAILLDYCRLRNPCPNEKILTNLCTFLRCDPEYTPQIFKPNELPYTTNESELWKKDNYSGIVTLINQQKNAERATFKRSNSSGRGPGRPSMNEVQIEELVRDDEPQKLNRIQRRGATLALKGITCFFGAELPHKLPKLWDLIVGQLVNKVDPNNFIPVYGNDQEAEQLVWDLQVLEVTSSSLHKSLLPELMDKSLSRLCILLSHPYRAVRHLSARCLAVHAKLNSVRVMEQVVSKVLPKLGATDCDIDRHGAVEAIACIVDNLQYDIIPYVVLLVVPLLGRMSDQNMSVRLMGTHSFATLVQLMPLDGGVPEPPALKDSILNEERNREREFLQQLLTPSSIPDYVIPVPIAAELRSYQQAGVNWLSFLNKYKLHGILCDDMGLGKTLQSICILAGDHYYRDQNYRQSKSADCAPMPSLVVCPPTLTGHWVYEVEKFVSHKHLRPLQYNGNPVEREKLRSKFRKYNLIVASYDIVRKDNNFFSNIKWNYVILDEGHVIKNGKTRTSLAIKNLMANHRLILSGTPIQNNVLELWSLFDFLMPGFLGTEKQFTARYSRPILASRDPKCSPKDQEAGALAMEALHRQVLPFLLRRMKEDVLDDLPPKITQDYYCELSPLQEQLYEDFSKSQAHQTLQDSISSGATASSIQGNTHIFQALRYLQNVCNHPKLVLNLSHPQYQNIMNQLQQQNSRLDDINHSAKLPALKQLLNDCGIGLSQENCIYKESAEIAINQHRALIFCQLKAMLDIIENDLFKKNMTTVTYLRLDGSIPPAMRHSVVTRFNNDPSIDVLLLTTQVGGLGLNLTGADTVIFVEHDWNPMKDLQAMDRAHRIGQRKVVNVYRLITRLTLEEKIMGNYIKTSKYSLLTFLPLNLFEQFQRLANFYFLCLLVLQLIPAISSLTPVTTALPLIGVLGLTAIKDAYDDIQRHVSDSHVNNRKSLVIRNGKLVKEKWSAVQVGDIIRMDNNTFVAADLLLLTSSEPNGLCYIETSELDGETNLKCRQCLVETAEMGQDDTLLGEFDGEIVCEQPNNLLNKFEGILIWKGRTFSLDNDKIILRGCVLRNTSWCYGVVIFAGKDTKLMQNSGKSKFKRTSIDRLLNFLIIGIVFFLLSMCLFCMVACGIWESLVGRYFQTFLPWDSLVPSEPLGGATIIALLVFFSYAIVLNTVVPISLYVSVEVIRFVQSFQINWDEEMYHKKYNAFAKARTTTLNEELGQIEYIFSDKTGTLTQNIMTFNKCSIGGNCYGDIIDPRSGDVIEITEDTEPLDFSFNENYEPEFRFYDRNLLDAVRRKDHATFLFFRLLALCHTVMSEQKDGKLEYQAQSPDESALVSAARNFGFVFKERTPNSITIEVMGNKEVYELLCILDFNNIRKRMSVILRRDGKLTLYCKGADNVIYERLKSGQEELKTKTQDHLNKFAGEGLRTLCLAYCDLEENFFNDWKQRHQEAAIALDNREEKLDQIYEEIERDMLLIGATAIEDKLQDGVPSTIANLVMAGIKIWVLTGDKQETAINIGYSCQLLTDDLLDMFVVDASTYDETQQQLLKFRDNIKIVNTYQPHSPLSSTHVESTMDLDAIHKINNTENGVSGANGTRVGGTPTQSSGTGPPAVSVVTFRWAGAESNKCKRASTELEYLGGVEDPQVEETTAGFAIVVNGHSLVHCLHPQMERLFLDVVMQCKAVICCRVTPLQKALVVEMVKKNKHAVTLAIGDGANDVSMIKAAHIGVGISGEEGMQAVLASDYSIGQFRFLERLLLVHGRWSYYRMCAFLRYFFNKNFAFTLCHFWYAFFCGFSAQTVFDPMYISIYNLFYTSLPVLALGVFDQDVNDKNSVAYPQLYKPGHLNLFFNKKEFFRSALQGCFVSIVLVFVPFGTYYDAVAPNGQGLSDYMLFCSATAAILVIVNSAQIALDTQYWTVFNHVTIWGSLAFYFIADNFYNYVCNGPYVGSLTKAMVGANFWFTTVLIVTMCVLPVLAYRFYFVDVFPTLSDRVRLKQRLAQVRSRQSQDILRTPSARRARRSIRSGYAFAHQEGFGRLITSGKIMRKLPNSEFTIPNLMNKLNISNSKESTKNPPNSAASNSNSQDSSSGGRAPIQDLDTINL